MQVFQRDLQKGWTLDAGIASEVVENAGRWFCTEERQRNSWSLARIDQIVRRNCEVVGIASPLASFAGREGIAGLAEKL